VLSTDNPRRGRVGESPSPTEEGRIVMRVADVFTPYSADRDRDRDRDPGRRNHDDHREHHRGHWDRWHRWCWDD
jgi:hypothetical protein